MLLKTLFLTKTCWWAKKLLGFVYKHFAIKTYHIIRHSCKCDIWTRHAILNKVNRFINRKTYFEMIKNAFLKYRPIFFPWNMLCHRHKSTLLRQPVNLRGSKLWYLDSQKRNDYYSCLSAHSVYIISFKKLNLS